MFSNSTLYSPAATDEYDDEDVIIETESTTERPINQNSALCFGNYVQVSEPAPISSVQGHVMLMRPIHPEASEEDVRDFLLDLSACRPLELRLPSEHATGLLKGYALVEYPSKAVADSTRDRLLAHPAATFMGKRISMDYCFVQDRHSHLTHQ